MQNNLSIINYFASILSHFALLFILQLFTSHSSAYICSTKVYNLLIQLNLKVRLFGSSLLKLEIVVPIYDIFDTFNCKLKRKSISAKSHIERTYSLLAGLLQVFYVITVTNKGSLLDMRVISNKS